MTGLLLFIISFCMVLTSSYFLTSIIKSKRFENSIIYMILIFVSQIIVNVEILSIIKQLNPQGILISNLFILIPTFLYWKYKGFPYIDLSKIKLTKEKIYLALKQDRILSLIFFFFILSSTVSLFLIIIVPTNSIDSMIYHLARIGFWLQHQTLAHFETSSIRQIIYSVNSEILILWSMAFLKRDYLSQVPQYLAYWGCLFLIYNYLRYLKVSTKRTLWTVLIFGSLPAAIIESTSTQTNLIVAFFLFASFYLFVYGVKENSNKALIFSAIAFSLDIGIKYSVFFFVPVFGIIYLLISIRERKYEFYKPILVFMAASIPAFLILSSYNHILNFIHFGNFIAPISHIHKLSSDTHGYKAFLANLIRYFLIFFDFTGIYSAKMLNSFYMGMKDFLFHIFSLQSYDGLAYADIESINTRIQENYSKFGLLGFFLLLPLIFRYSFINLGATKDKKYYISLTGLVTVIFLISISILMGFCYWSNRFILTAIAISITVLALSYTKKLSLLKIIVTLVVILNYLLIPIFNESKPLLQLSKIKAPDILSFRNEVRYRDERYFSDRMPVYYLFQYIHSVIPDNSKIGLIFSEFDWYYPFFEENSTWKVYPLRYELLAKRKNYNDYDFIIISRERQQIDIIDMSSIAFNYTIEGEDIIWRQNNPDDPIIIYIGRNKVITEGIPILMDTTIDFSRIPDNFKLIRKLEIIDKYKKHDIEKSHLFFIYKKFREK